MIQIRRERIIPKKSQDKIKIGTGLMEQMEVSNQTSYNPFNINDLEKMLQQMNKRDPFKKLQNDKTKKEI